ncbi:ATP-binding cassette domain-containing protein [Dyadobacter aurulentus]|uniref:ATP-binding cassette domain-containing protein n=1 Tax=Dyadobacter sp. UC 10 TaxID=2605428 RepID=UPI002106F313|nr:ATP-binding cassette domain-containing protein [Dyadobacter sp. UC 10]
MAYLPQKPFVPGHLEVKKAFMLYKSQICEALNYFPEVEQLLSLRFDQLSGGQQRLIETIMVISSPSSFIILDEPFSNVMPLHIETVKAWLSVLKRSKGILVTDHYYRDVLTISDYIYLLNMDGRTIKLTEPIKQLKDFGYTN